jgi:hypothetical protein
MTIKKVFTDFTRALLFMALYGCIGSSGDFKHGLVLDKLSVESFYLDNGNNWNDYIKNDGSSKLEAQDNICIGNESSVDECFHAAPYKYISFPGSVSSCYNLTMIDALGAFDWTCAKGQSGIYFYSTLKSNKGLPDLLDGANGWKDNHIYLFEGTRLVTTSDPAKWWGNNVEALPDNSSGPCSPALLNQEGTIYVANESRSTCGYILAADKIGIAIMKGVKLSNSADTVAYFEDRHYASSGASYYHDSGNINYTSSGISTSTSDPVAGTFGAGLTGLKFISIEGDASDNTDTGHWSMDANGTTSVAIHFSAASFVNINNVKVLGFQRAIKFAEATNSSKISNVTIDGSSGNNGIVFQDGGAGNLIESITVESGVNGILFGSSASDNQIKNVSIEVPVLSDGVTYEGGQGTNTESNLNISTP